MAKAQRLSAEIQQDKTQIKELENAKTGKGISAIEGAQIDRLKNECREKKTELRDTIQRLVPRLDFSTLTDRAVFYAKDEGKEAAETLCEGTEYKTIEKTAGGQWIEGLRVYECLSERNARNISAAASIEYAYASSGKATTFGRTEHKNSLLWRDEIPALHQNRENTGINFKSPFSTKTKMHAHSVSMGSTIKQAELVNRLAAYEKACHSRMERQPTMERTKPRDKGIDYE